MITITPQHAMPTRAHPRVDAKFMVKLVANGRSILAKAEDLSMAGLRLVGDFAAFGQRVQLTIPVPGHREVTTQATVRRVGVDDAAVEFDELDWDDMFVMAKYLHPRLP